ncbi:MAG: GNAT family N-acetyltransferase [Oscillospiraceae bacterium]|jgi:RimJ/RimL family protein N-acetyltransferase|nr:GNAT family N-acetyltransferase [Oscillospiraceae bacterium]
MSCNIVKNDSFTSDRLTYTGITDDDTSILVKWRSDVDVIRFFKNNEPITVQSHTVWFNDFYLPDDTRYDFIITEKITNSKIGTVSIKDIDYSDHSCEISYMIAENDFQRKGFASEAVIAMMKKMNVEGITTFRAEIHINNTASIKMIEKLGFLFKSQNGEFLQYIT